MTHFESDEAAQIAYSLARGCYQRSRLTYGVWSGADLKGRARRYSYQYKASRESLIRRLQADPRLTCTVSTYKGGPGNGRRDVTIGLRGGK